VSVLTARKRLPIPAISGQSPEEASSVYQDVYGEMPVPATRYASTVTALASLETSPSVRTVASNASVVQRADRKNGMVSIGGRQSYETATPQINNPVDSSKFQDWLMGPQVNFSQNANWYIAYPAATVMTGGAHNLGWSERVPQLPTRTTGGPGPSQMRSAPRFKSVQTIPRYSTMPGMYPTTSAPG
jgi:hypothetical protein